MQRILLVLIVFISVSCSTQKKLQRIYVGYPTSKLVEEFGVPKTVIDKGEEEIYVFEKVSELKSTEISQGKLTLDPMVSPMVQKTEHFYFTVQNGKVIKVKLEEKYKR